MRAKFQIELKKLSCLSYGQKDPIQFSQHNSAQCQGRTRVYDVFRYVWGLLYHNNTQRVVLPYKSSFFPFLSNCKQKDKLWLCHIEKGIKDSEVSLCLKEINNGLSCRANFFWRDKYLWNTAYPSDFVGTGSWEPHMDSQAWIAWLLGCVLFFFFLFISELW